MPLDDKILLLIIALPIVIFVCCLYMLCRYDDSDEIRVKRSRERRNRAELDNLFSGWGETPQIVHEIQQTSLPVTTASPDRDALPIQSPAIVVNRTQEDVIDSTTTHDECPHCHSHLAPAQVNRNRSRSPSPARLPQPSAPSELDDLPPSYDNAIHSISTT